MASTRPESQVSIDDILEYTSVNENQSPEEEAAQLQELAEEIPADLVPQLFTPEAPVNNPYRGPCPNTEVYAISKAQLSLRAGHQFVPLSAPTAEMLAAAAMPEISELIPQDHPEWQHLRSGKVTGSSLAETLGLFEQGAGKALSGVGVMPYMRDHNKLLCKVASLQSHQQAPATVDAQTQVYFDWGHKHEANGILSYLKANPRCAVHEVGFVLLDPSLQSLPEEVTRGIIPANLPVIGSSPDGVIVQHTKPVSHQLNQHWRESHPAQRLVLEIKAKTPFRPDPALGIWHWLGQSCKSYVKILPQYFAQAQLNMLVTESQACHLLCYTVRGGSVIFTIPLDQQWCNQMLHWVSELNTQYIVKGLAPPENVFWEQEEYRQFVQLTKKACESVGSSRVCVPSEHGSQTWPLFCHPPVEDDDVVPNTPEVGGSQAPQQLQGHVHQQVRQQTDQQQPPHWQGHQQRHVMPNTAGNSAADQGPARLQGPAVPSAAPSLHLLAAAAIPLPDEDTRMEDAEEVQVLGTEALANQPPEQPQLGPQGSDQQGSPTDPTSPIGPHGLASWMQRTLHRLGVDLKSLLDASCLKALSLLAAADVAGALERVAQDVRAGWPKNVSALCMHRIKHLQPPTTPATSSGAANSHPGAAARSPGLGLPGHGGAAISPGAVATGPGAAAVNSPGLAMSGLPSPAPASGSVQRQLWPDNFPSHDQGVAYRHGTGLLSPAAGSSNAGLHTGSLQAAANSPAGATGPGSSLSSVEHFGGRPFPAAMSHRVRVRLYAVVANCNLYVREEDFDAPILERLARMPEWRAMSVLQQAEDANWPVVHNNTRMIMSWCHRHDC